MKIQEKLELLKLLMECSSPDLKQLMGIANKFKSDSLSPQVIDLYGEEGNVRNI